MFIRSRNRVPMAFRVRRHKASEPHGSSERVLPWQVTMDELICASLSYTHYWYEVGMLEVPAVLTIEYAVPVLDNAISRVFSQQ